MICLLNYQTMNYKNGIIVTGKVCHDDDDDDDWDDHNDDDDDDDISDGDGGHYYPKDEVLIASL